MKRCLTLMALLTAVVALLAGCPPEETEVTPADETTQTVPEEDVDTRADEAEGVSLTVEQEEGGTVYWVMPGPRRISRVVFGTPQNPLMGDDTLAIRKWQAEQMPGGMGGAVSQLLSDLPILVALPEAARETNEAGDQYTTTTMPTLLGDEGEVVSGSFSLTYHDRQPWDTPGDPTDTADMVEADVMFTDPAGNEYTFDIKSTLMPPIPGYHTGGGVMTNYLLHGMTGTGTPLFPEVYVYGASYHVGDILVNGEVVDENCVIHFMTTQIARKSDYVLAIDEEMPLAPADTIAGQVHHTHVIALPIKIRPEGPVYEAVKTQFELPNGEMQPFIHAMFEEDRIVDSPFAAAPMAAEGEATHEAEQNSADASSVTVVGNEFSFEPDRITATRGEEVTITFKNEGSLSHDLYIEGYDVQTDTIPGGESDTISFTADEAGEFAFWCTISGHRGQGMEGTLVVQQA